MMFMWIIAMTMQYLKIISSSIGRKTQRVHRWHICFHGATVNPYFINDVPITDIPDVYDTTPFAYEILDLYNKGVAVGSDEYMTFYPDSQVKRSEAAALISRILCYDMRIELPKG